MSDCEQLKEHYESYALGALEGEERVELEAHLARGCPACTPEVERARWLVAQLAYLAPEAEPPAALRRRVLQAVSEPRPRERRSWIPVWAWAGAAALAFFAAYSAVESRRYQAELSVLQEQVRAARRQNEAMEVERQTYQRALAILSASGTREVALKPAQASLPEFRAFWHGEMGLVLAGYKIPSPAPGRIWQLWVVPKKGNPLSAGLVRPDANGHVLFVPRPEAEIAEAAALAISDEPAGGSSQPTTKPLWVGPVS